MPVDLSFKSHKTASRVRCVKDDRDGTGGTDPIPSRSLRLDPSSGLCFFDLEMPAASLAQIHGRFAEIRSDGRADVLLPLEEPLDGDGVAWHPVTHMPLGPDETHWISGYAAFEPFLDSWILRWPRFFGQIFRFDKWIDCRCQAAKRIGSMLSCPQ